VDARDEANRFYRIYNDFILDDRRPADVIELADNRPNLISHEALTKPHRCWNVAIERGSDRTDLFSFPGRLHDLFEELASEVVVLVRIRIQQQLINLLKNHYYHIYNECAELDTRRNLFDYTLAKEETIFAYDSLLSKYASPLRAGRRRNPPF
jgi:hypothetical protein